MTQIIFNADVTIVPEVPARLTGNPDNWCEGEPMEFCINELYVRGENVEFLLESDIGLQIEDAVLKLLSNGHNWEGL